MTGMYGNPMGWDWDPWRQFRQLQREVGQLFGGGTAWQGGQYPAVNMWTDENDVVLTTEMPGVKSDDLDISVQKNIVTLRGKRTIADADKNETVHRQERASGQFARSIRLPFAVDAEKVSASLNKGILRLTLPQAQSEAVKKIEVKAS